MNELIDWIIFNRDENSTPPPLTWGLEEVEMPVMVVKP